ncbi:MAG: flagella basal body P-ring formation protein FlgA, partial [Oscillospiraceae bacterium]
MQKIMKNRLVLGGIAIAIALLICFVFVPMIYNNKAEMTEVVRVVTPISAGEVIKKENVEVVTVGGYNLAKDVMKSTKDVVGKYALADFTKDDYILSNKLGSQYIKKDNYLTALKDNQMAVSVSIKDLAQGVSGELQVNDIISVVVVESATKSMIP